MSAKQLPRARHTDWSNPVPMPDHAARSLRSVPIAGFSACQELYSRGPSKLHYHASPVLDEVGIEFPGCTLMHCDCEFMGFRRRGGKQIRAVSTAPRGTDGEIRRTDFRCPRQGTGSHRPCCIPIVLTGDFCRYRDGEAMTCFTLGRRGTNCQDANLATVPSDTCDWSTTARCAGLVLRQRHKFDFARSMISSCLPLSNALTM